MPHDPDCQCATCQLDDALGYDADHTDPRQYCRHGTFIGSWWGPDYLCPYCEMGDYPDDADPVYRCSICDELYAARDHINGEPYFTGDADYLICPACLAQQQQAP